MNNNIKAFSLLIVVIIVMTMITILSTQVNKKYYVDSLKDEIVQAQKIVSDQITYKNNEVFNIGTIILELLKTHSAVKTQAIAGILKNTHRITHQVDSIHIVYDKNSEGHSNMHFIKDTRGEFGFIEISPTESAFEGYRPIVDKYSTFFGLTSAIIKFTTGDLYAKYIFPIWNHGIVEGYVIILEKTEAITTLLENNDSILDIKFVVSTDEGQVIADTTGDIFSKKDTNIITPTYADNNLLQMLDQNKLGINIKNENLPFLDEYFNDAFEQIVVEQDDENLFTGYNVTTHEELFISSARINTSDWTIISVVTKSNLLSSINVLFYENIFIFIIGIIITMTFSYFLLRPMIIQKNIVHAALKRLPYIKTNELDALKIPNASKDSLSDAFNEILLKFQSYIKSIENKIDYIDSETNRIFQYTKKQSILLDDLHTKTSVKSELNEKINHLIDSNINIMGDISIKTKKHRKLGKKVQIILERLLKSQEEVNNQFHSILNQLESFSEKKEETKALTEALIKIADKTNLLSLNATLEAKKSAETDPGFSVIAKELQKISENLLETCIDIRNSLKSEDKNFTNTIDDIKLVLRDLSTTEKHEYSLNRMVEELVNSLDIISPKTDILKDELYNNIERGTKINNEILDYIKKVTEYHMDYNFIKKTHEDLVQNISYIKSYSNKLDTIDN